MVGTCTSTPYKGETWGVSGSSSGTTTESTRFSVYGQASGAAYAYGVCGTASGGASCNAAGYFSGDVWASTYNVISDRKFKTDIALVKNSVSQIMKLKPSTYTFKPESIEAMNLPVGNQIGLIADEVNQVYPTLVNSAVQPATHAQQRAVVITPQQQ